MTLPARDNDIANFEKDFSVLERSHPNKPLYKPEYWDQIQDLDWNGLTADPVFSCKPAGVPRIGDFGVARVVGRDAVRITREGELLGTARYMSPEQACRVWEVDERSDLYGLGCLFYFMVTGRDPYHECENVIQVLSKLAEGAGLDPRTVRGEI